MLHQSRRNHISAWQTRTGPRCNNALRKSKELYDARAPPRDGNGQIYCDHVNCSGRTQTFKRVCEWNKHMDRHERPYKCREAGCELNPGFTCSGGLLRHQQKVRKMHLSTKQSLFCPFPNCNRGSGASFTRKEKLEEHKRRRHLEELWIPSQVERRLDLPLTVIPQETSRKRRRISTAVDVHGQELESEVANAYNNIGISESQLVQALPAQIQQKDEYIQRQGAEIQRLLSLISSIRPRAIYGVMQPHKEQVIFRSLLHGCRLT